MKLDVNVLRYLSKEDFRVLTAVEMGQKNVSFTCKGLIGPTRLQGSLNSSEAAALTLGCTFHLQHELVPVQLIDTISGLKHGGAHRCLKTLLRHKLVHHESAKYDGYRLTYMGYDFLAIKVLANRGHISSVGRQIGVGKESDIFEVMNDEGEVFALKLHRLGRTSFRAVKSKRDYLGKRNSFSWLYLSRLAALKEFAFMKALGDHGFPVPVAVDNNRHAVLMTLVDAAPLVQVKEIARPAFVYNQAMDLIARLGAKGLVHCDFNEFNLLVDDDEALTLIDFPQMVSIGHANAEELFERDVNCIVRYFNKKIGYMPQQDEALERWRPDFKAAVAAAEAAATAAGGKGLDSELAASGFQRQHQQALEAFLEGAAEADDDADDGGDGSDDGDEGRLAAVEEEAGGADVAEASGGEDAGGSSDSGSREGREEQEESQLGPSGRNHQLPLSGRGRADVAAGSADGNAASAAQHIMAQRVAADGAGAVSAAAGQAQSAAADESSAGAASAAAGVSDLEADRAEVAAALAQLGFGRQGSADGAESDGASSSGGDGESEQERVAVRPAARSKVGSVRRSSIAASLAGDAAQQERLVQQRLSQQKKKAGQMAAAAKASRNSSKARGKKGSSKDAGSMDF